jgi:hypothetical protein
LVFIGVFGASKMIKDKLLEIWFDMIWENEKFKFLNSLDSRLFIRIGRFPITWRQVK